MKEIFISGKKVTLTDTQYRVYRKHKNREKYIFGRQEWNAKVCQLDYLPFQVPSGVNVEDEFERKLILRKLHTALEILEEKTPDDYKVIEVVFFDEVKPDKAAKLLKIKRTTLLYRQARALKLLREIMENLPDNLSEK